MKPSVMCLLTISCALAPTVLAAQVVNNGPKAATYITDEDVKKVNALPGVDRQIISLDIGKLNEAIGIVHRGPTNRPAAATANAPAATPPAPPTPAEQCGERPATPPPPGSPTGIAHDHQTETYIIVSGGGTMITGGRIVNGRKSAPDSTVTKILNGPSCSGVIGGSDVVRRTVKTGDIVVIPAGVPHGWAEITDHVDYLSVRPDPDRVLAPYVNPAVAAK